MQKEFCSRFNLSPEKVLMIGDSVHDLVAGNAANMISIGVLTGIATTDELTNYADIILNNIGEIPNLLHNKNFN